MTKICVIGAGPSGLSVLRAFENARKDGVDIPEIVCYEKQSDVGGLWNYTWRTGLDEFGEKVHGGMYRSLWSNGPKECLEFGDYSFEEHFGRPIPSFPPREVLHDYIRGRIEKSCGLQKIKLNTAVRWVEYSESTGRFTVSVKDLKKDEISSDKFDYVIVAVGHFSTPNVPFFEGIDKFPGRVIHSHDFRRADDYAGKNVLVVGASYSAEDIGLQCRKYGAKSVTYSYRTKAMAFKWPKGIEELPLLTRLEGNVAHFKNGESREIDAIILCTGYLHSFPFLPDNLRLKTKNLFYPPLYKGIFFEKNTKLIYIGMQDQLFSYNMFDAQAWYARDVILGRITLPSSEEMAADLKAWQSREEKVKTVFNMNQLIDFQRDYIRDMIAVTDYSKLRVDNMAELFKEWERHKQADIVSYRDHSHVSTMTGTLAPKHRAPWQQALDDTLIAFVGSEQQ